jgi:hypothetical protein
MEQKISSPNITEIIFVSGLPHKVGWIITRDGLCIISKTASEIIKNSKEVRTNND